MQAARLWALLGALSAPLSQGAEPTLRLDLGNGVGLDLVLVSAGSFRQGSPPGEAGRGEDETPRDVTLTRDFYIGKTEVTVAQFRRFVEETGYRTEAEKGTSGGFGWDGRALVQAPRFTWRDPGYPLSDAHPVSIVTYDDALAFASWLAGRAGRGVSLPTEAQWEFAARGGTSSRTYAGEAEDAVREIGWFKANAGNGPQPVAQKRPNAFGLHDTAGNLYEWCRDWYGPYVPGAVSDPEETRSTLSDRPRRVLRGGSWLKDARALRSAARYRNTPGSRNADNGFRVVADAQAGPPPTAPGVADAGLATAPSAPDDGPSARTIVFGVLAGIVAVAGTLIAALAYALRRARGPAGSLKTRPETDGFRIRGAGLVAGQKVRYRYVADGRSQTGEITVTGGGDEGVFVYTGSRPSSVEVLGVLGAGATRPQPDRARRQDPRRDEPRRDDDTPFRGYPSAY